MTFTQEARDAGPVLYNFTQQTLRGEEQPGLTVFAKEDAGNICRAYPTYERGLDLLLGTYNLLDLTPKDREESGPMRWVRFHDRYAPQAYSTIPT